MISTKFVGGAAALALIAALNLPTASFAFHGGHGGGWGGGGGVHFSGGGRSMGGGAPAMRSFAAAPAARSFAAAPAARSFAASPAGAWNGGRAAWNGNNGAWRGGFHHRHFFPGAFAAGVAVGALGSSYAYYGGPDYYYDSGYSDTYYDNGGYYDDGTTVAVVPGVVGADPAYCAQRFRSYDPASGTYLGVDGLRHPCP
jgi:BA14K-like protein